MGFRRGLLLITVALGLTGLGRSQPAHPLPPEVLARFDTATFGKHWGPVFAVAFSPDGITVASIVGGNDHRAVSLWDPAGGKEVRRWPVPPSSLALAFSPDGRTLAVVSGGEAKDSPIGLWDVASGKPCPPVPTPPRGAWSVAFSPDRNAVVAGSTGPAFRLWEMASGKTLQLFNAREWAVHAVAFSPDGQMLASGHEDGMIRLWDVGGGKERRALQGKQGRIASLAFSPYGRTLASAGLDQAVYLWETATGKERRRFDGHQRWVNAVAFSPDGRTLASASWDSTVRLWEVATGRERRRLAGHQGAVLSIAFSPDGRSLASSSFDTTALIWKIHAPLAIRPRDGVKVSVKELDALWVDLAGQDAAQADRAIQALVLAREEAVPYLHGRLRARVPVNTRNIGQMITDLDDDRFAVRERASKELAGLGALAEPGLRAALAKNPPLEVRRRIELLLSRPGAHDLPSDVVRVLRAVEALEHIGTPESRKAIEKLAQAEAETWVTQEARSALKRLVSR
jgi:sugar lactone lactonase YvrE